MPDNNDYRLVTFAGSDQSDARRFDVWRELMNRKLLRVAMDPLQDTPYRVNAALRPLPHLRVAVGASSPAVHHRPRGVTCDENEDIALLVNLRGRAVARGRSGDVTIEPGDAFLLKCHEAGTYVHTEPGTKLVVRIDPESMGAAGDRAERATGMLAPAGTPGLSLLTSYALRLTRGELFYSATLTQMVTAHVGDLISLIVGARGDAAAEARSRGLAAARLAMAKTYVREHLDDPTLSEGAAAAHQGVGSRYLRRLFTAAGESFTGYVLEQRLRQANAMLTSLRFAKLAVFEIAYEVGFGDLSYFNRSFRRRFERTPSEVRAEAAERWHEPEMVSGAAQ